MVPPSRKKQTRGQKVATRARRACPDGDALSAMVAFTHGAKNARGRLRTTGSRGFQQWPWTAFYHPLMEDILALDGPRASSGGGSSQSKHI